MFQILLNSNFIPADLYFIKKKLHYSISNGIRTIALYKGNKTFNRYVIYHFKKKNYITYSLITHALHVTTWFEQTPVQVGTCDYC